MYVSTAAAQGQDAGSLTTGSTAAPTDLAADQFDWAPTNKQPESRYKKRAGYTTNKWRGAGKARRKMAAASRRRNRAR